MEAKPSVLKRIRARCKQVLGRSNHAANAKHYDKEVKDSSATTQQTREVRAVTPVKNDTENLSSSQGSGFHSSHTTPVKPANVTPLTPATKQMASLSDNSRPSADDMTRIPKLKFRAPTFESITESVRTLPIFPNTHLTPTSQKGSNLRPPRSPPPSVVMEDLNGEILPEEIAVKVTIRWSGKRVWEAEHPFPKFEWKNEAKYEELLPTKIIEKSQTTYPELDGKDVYHRHGSCRITSAPELPAEMHYRILDDGELSILIDNAAPLICGFISQYPRRKFSLEIYWEYGYACLQPQTPLDGAGSQTFKKMIRLELQNKLQTNFRNQGYISRRDQSAFQQYEVVENLILHDKKFSSFSQSAKKDFVNQIIKRPALKLLLNCVYSGVRLDFLHHMIEVHDLDDHTHEKPKTECSLGYCEDQLGVIWRERSIFHVRNVEQDFTHHPLDVSVVMPLRYTTDGAEPVLLGDGASSQVYRVCIDSAHHYLSGDPGCSFALKEFSSEREKEFEREKAMLTVLADHPNPNPDIVPHITSWSQSRSHYILYPEARYNLRQFMQGVRRIGFSSHETLWFLRQLQGLALAVDHVHHLKHPTNSQPDPKEDAYWGCHFDIKPENILVFEKVPGHHSRFKITDFGVGIFHPAGKEGVHSVLTSEAHGTLTYFAPDKESIGTVSRPFDMWALGCVYLELMLWLFGFFEDSEGGFSTARFDCTGALPNNRNDKFWRLVSTPEGNKYTLLSIVEKVIGDLKKVWCIKMPAFLGILDAVDHLLEVDIERRWKAVQLKTHMAQILRKAEDDLASDESLYHTLYEANYNAERIRQAFPGSSDNTAEAVQEPGSTSAARLKPKDESSRQGKDKSQESSKLSQADRESAAESIVQAGSVTDVTLPANQDQDASDNRGTGPSRPRTGRDSDPLARDLNRMVEASTASSARHEKALSPD